MIEHTCEHCGTTFTRRKGFGTGRFCSRSCVARAIVAGKNRQDISTTCENCGAEFKIPASRLETARACSRQCLGDLQSKERKGTFGVGTDNPMWVDGRSPYSYRKQLKDACERCGANENLLVHHRDENRRNNDPMNLETLCKRCHQIEHRCWENLPDNTGRVRTRFPQPCEWCGEMFVRAAGHVTARFCSRRCAMLKRQSHRSSGVSSV